MLFSSVYFTQKFCYSFFEVNKMAFELKKTRQKVETVTKSVYMQRSLAERIEKIAVENKTSFSNVVVSMVESCLKDLDEQ